jgi:phosphatidylglycerophosphate synthase
MSDLDGLKKAAWPEISRARETADEFFFRPISLRISNRLVRTAVQPNQITILSFAFLLLGACLFLFASYGLTVVAAILIYFSDVFDCVDGEIARAKKLVTRSGAVLDYFVDRLGDIIVYSCVTFALFTRAMDMRMLLLGAFVVVSNSFMTDIGQKVSLEKEEAQVVAGRGLVRFVRYGGCANTLILLIASILNNIAAGMMVIGILCFAFTIARAVEAYYVLEQHNHRAGKQYQGS